jgi:hypothetical protein
MSTAKKVLAAVQQVENLAELRGILKFHHKGAKAPTPASRSALLSKMRW